MKWHLKCISLQEKRRLFFAMNRLLPVLFLLLMASFSFADEPEFRLGTNPQATPASALAALDVAADVGTYLRLPFKPEFNSDNHKRFAEWNLSETQPSTFSPEALAESMVDLDSFKKMKRTPTAKGQGPVPESSTMLMIGLGLLGLSGFGARRKFKR